MVGTTTATTVGRSIAFRAEAQRRLAVTQRMRAAPHIISIRHTLSFLRGWCRRARIATWAPHDRDQIKANDVRRSSAFVQVMYVQVRGLRKK